MTDARLKYPTMSRARLKMLNEPGLLYAAYSGFCDWIKIGFTSKPAAERLDGLNRQYALFAPFSLIGATPSTHAVEQKFHRILSPFRQFRTASTKELYPAAPSVVSLVREMLKHDQTVPFERHEYREMYEWAWRAARVPLNQQIALECFERFQIERKAA